MRRGNTLFFNNQLPIKWFYVDYNYFNKTIDDVLNYIKNS